MLNELYYFNEDSIGFSNNLKKLIKEKKLRSDDIAEQLGYECHELLKKWKTGKRMPNLDMVYKLSKILDVSMEELFLPRGILRINENHYTKLFISTNEDKYELLKRFYPSFHKGENLEMLLTHDELLKQRDFKEEINYLLQKNLLSYLTELEEEKLRFYFKHVLCNSFEDNDGYHCVRLDYDSFWKEINDEVVGRRGKSYKYEMTEDIAKKELFELQKKIEFGADMPLSLPQSAIIYDVIEMLNDIELIKDYFGQFDSILLNCIYTFDGLNDDVKRVLAELGAKRIKATFSRPIQCIDDIYEEVRKMAYDEYLSSLGGEE